MHLVRYQVVNDASQPLQPADWWLVSTYRHRR